MDSHHSLSASLISNAWRANLGHPPHSPLTINGSTLAAPTAAVATVSSASYALQYAAYSGESGPDYEPEYQQPPSSRSLLPSLSQPSVLVVKPGIEPTLPPVVGLGRRSVSIRPRSVTGRARRYATAPQHRLIVPLTPAASTIPSRQGGRHAGDGFIFD
ncbi:hypothetical protein BC629DRAFT_1740225, partial [Irpex lacteus]